MQLHDRRAFGLTQFNNDIRPSYVAFILDLVPRTCINSTWYKLLAFLCISYHLADLLTSSLSGDFGAAPRHSIGA